MRPPWPRLRRRRVSRRIGAALPAAARRARAAIAPALLVAAVALVFARGLDAPFVFDDVHAIVENPHLRQLWPPTSALSAPAESSLSGRPLASLSFALDYAVGGLDPRGYRVTNVVLHALSALLLLALVRRTLATPSLAPRFGRDAGSLAPAIAALWALHPLQSESVAYVVQRTELLMGFFLLATVWAAARGFGSDRHRTAWFVVSALACVCGMASKEVMAAAPPIVLLYDRGFVSGSFRSAIRRHGGLYAGLAAGWVGLALLSDPSQRSASVGFHHGVSALRYLWTQAGVVLWYLRLVFWPHPLVIAYDWPIAARFSEAAPQVVVASALALATLVALARRAALGFAGAWFFLILAPTSSLLPIVTEVAAERRMYLPLAAVVACVVLAAQRGAAAVVARPAARRTALRAMLATLGVAAALALSARTVARLAHYRSAEALWSATLEHVPGHRQAHDMHFEIARDLARRGRLGDAASHYALALARRPDFFEAWANLANLRAQQGRLEEAISAYERAHSLAPGHAEIEVSLGLAHGRAGRTLAAQEHLEAALKLAPEHGIAHVALARISLRRGESARALRHAQRAVAALPADAEAWSTLGQALSAAGRHEEALAGFDEALRLDPENRGAKLRRLETQVVLQGRTAPGAE